MAYNSLRELPKEVRDEITDDKYSAIDRELFTTYDLTLEQIDAYGSIILDIILGRRRAIDLTDVLSRFPDRENVDIRNLALDLAVKRLWPIQDFLGDVDVLIKRLGGIVPPKYFLRHTVEAGSANEPQESWSHSSVKEVIQNFKQYGEYYLTQKPIRDTDGRLKAPSVANWLAEYLHMMGAEKGSNLKRSQYMVKSQNALRLNNAEKENLLNFLVSYEENAPMYWKTEGDQYLLILQELPGAEKKKKEISEQYQMSDLLSYYQSIQRNYQKLFDEKKKGIEVEIQGNTKKIADIIWDSLGLGDADRCMTAFDLLIDHHGLEEMLRSDQRYKGLMSRYLGVHFGNEAKTFWNGDLTTAMTLAIFWKLIFVEKLAVEESKAAIIADYFSKKLQQKQSPSYLDIAKGKFLFRDIAYKDRDFRFA